MNPRTETHRLQAFIERLYTDLSVNLDTHAIEIIDPSCGVDVGNDIETLKPGPNIDWPRDTDNIALVEVHINRRKHSAGSKKGDNEGPTRNSRRATGTGKARDQAIPTADQPSSKITDVTLDRQQQRQARTPPLEDGSFKLNEDGVIVRQRSRQVGSRRRSEYPSHHGFDEPDNQDHQKGIFRQTHSGGYSDVPSREISTFRIGRYGNKGQFGTIGSEPIVVAKVDKAAGTVIYIVVHTFPFNRLRLGNWTTGQKVVNVQRDVELDNGFVQMTSESDLDKLLLRHIEEQLETTKFVLPQDPWTLQRFEFER